MSQISSFWSFFIDICRGRTNNTCWTSWFFLSWKHGNILKRWRFWSYLIDLELLTFNWGFFQRYFFSYWRLFDWFSIQDDWSLLTFLDHWFWFWDCHWILSCLRFIFKLSFYYWGEVFISSPDVTVVHLWNWLFRTKNLFKIADENIGDGYWFTCVYEISHGRFFWSHEWGTEADGNIISWHFAFKLMRKYIFLQKLDKKGKSHKIEFRKLFDLFFDIPFSE